jgi:hypothetical protein
MSPPFVRHLFCWIGFHTPGGEILYGRSTINWLKVGFVGRSFPLPVAVCERIGCQNESSAVLGRSTAVVELP